MPTTIWGTDLVTYSLIEWWGGNIYTLHLVNGRVGSDDLVARVCPHLQNSKANGNVNSRRWIE
jgi:hypothetical protein